MAVSKDFSIALSSTVVSVDEFDIIYGYIEAQLAVDQLTSFYNAVCQSCVLESYIVHSGNRHRTPKTGVML